ncbi:hypothetical protein CLU86_1095 [Acidovorax sp. 62]|nr:hypothetical protein CLU86_1095 [Acidovorax sp. 62]
MTDIVTIGIDLAKNVSRKPCGTNWTARDILDIDSS